ncbi:MAG: AAA family ATPase [Candidatus Cloacimonetes bacterium]|nr:AAA family ATPase [Candidatus Cloacimonadota bacterium]MBS3767908.1 AAA family ATPase [Candidatus Cloacimonadota bacterium]
MEKILSEKDTQTVKNLAQAREKILKEIHKVIIGQERVIEYFLTALFSNGHCLLVGVPGLAKTLLISTISQTLNLKFSRIQFTPDLMPSDITGTDILTEDRTTGKRTFQFIRGPIFANIILADEINRTPPKTQAALLEAMQERNVTAGNHTYKLDEPFFVLATQNPIEQEGTYPLPEAQLDRFIFHVNIDYPSYEEEKEIAEFTTSQEFPVPDQVIDGHEIARLQKFIFTIPVSDHIIEFAVKLARLSRPEQEESPDFIKEWVNWGAGPRASQFLILAAKTRAALHGRYTPEIKDIEFIAEPILQHRILLNFSAEAEGLKTKDIITKLIDYVKKQTNK